jgi:hypothetical protein
MNRALDRLATVSRLFFEQRVVDLRKENEKLKAQNAWHEFGPEALQRALFIASSSTYTPVTCACRACWKARRFDTEYESMDHIMAEFQRGETRECMIKECLLIHAHQLGLSVVTRQETVLPDTLDPESFVKEARRRYDRCPDAHLEVWDQCDGGWEIVYGSKFASAQFHTNPDLGKLQELFEIITDSDDRFFYDDGERIWDRFQ